MLEQYGEAQTRRLSGLEYINKDPSRWLDVKRISWRGWTFKSPQGDRLAKPRYELGETVYITEKALYWVSPILEGVEYDKSSDWWTDCVYQDDPEIPALLADNGRLAMERSINQIVEGSSIVGKWEWKSAMFMPEHYARHFIFIEAVRAERVQEITQEDCIREGLKPQPMPYQPIRTYRQSFLDSFQHLWNTINPKYPFESNSWVWVYNFSLAKARR